ncbi:MAG: AAA family ATPase [Myxococcales bacterium]|nr:AAA family ATPase [Myxococcales bacterium]
MISHIRLRDFKGHRDTTVPLGRLTMLVGDNASGKTSVLQALELQAAMASPKARTAWHEPDDLLRRGAQDRFFLETFGVSQGSSWQMTTTVTAPTPSTSVWTAYEEGKLGERAFTRSLVWQPDGGLFESRSTTGLDNPSELKAHTGSARLYRLDGAQVAAPSLADEQSDVIATDGSNTAKALAGIKLDHDEIFLEIQSALGVLVPSIKGVRIKQVPTQAYGSDGTRATRTAYRIHLNLHGDQSIPADCASQGTLIVLALLTILHGPVRPNLLLLDDLDHALHPRAQMELMRMLKGLLALPKFQDLQIVATTHSPYVLDELTPAEVHVFALRDDGTVASKCLSEHPDAAKVPDALRTGELWSLDPERDWVLSG